MILHPVDLPIFCGKTILSKENSLTNNQMRKIGVIGLGHVGSTVAYKLITKGIDDELVLIDQSDALCTAEYYDYQDSLGRLDTYTIIIK